MSGDASNVISPDGCFVQSNGDKAAIAVGTNRPIICMWAATAIIRFLVCFAFERKFGFAGFSFGFGGKFGN